MPSPDETQERPAFRNRPAPSTKVATQEIRIHEEGPGCTVWALVGSMVVIFALIVLVLAVLAGWTSGQQTAQVNATGTQSYLNAEQCAQLEGEVQAGNTIRLQASMNYLLEQTPAVSCVGPYIPTATALYLTSPPTQPSPLATSAPPTDTPTIPPTPSPTLAVTAESTEVVTPSDSGYDLDALMESAQAAVGVSDWNEAIGALDAIMAIDPDYRPGVVERMMFDALTQQALQLYRSGEQLAEAIVLTDRAEEMGDIGELNFERIVARLYLDAGRNINVNPSEAIRLLQQIYNLAPNYRNGEVARELYRQRVVYGDALAQGGDPCAAITQYENALGLQSGGQAAVKLDEANIECQRIIATQQAAETDVPDESDTGESADDGSPDAVGDPGG